MFELPKNIDKSWTLFLDRDGVINRKLDADYVKHIGEFELIDGVLDALAIFTSMFGRIVIVTNQQGIGKELMHSKDLLVVHEHMLSLFEPRNIVIDAIYYCPHLASLKCDCRKPEPGMGYQAKKEFPEIDFNQSLLIGDSLSDIAFGEQLGMHTLFIEGDRKLVDLI